MPLTVTRRDIALIVLSIALVAIYAFVAKWGFPLDDSWIHQTYGRNLGLHGEWAFLLGQPSAASTSPLYTILLSIGYFLRIPYMLWTHGLGITALATTAILGIRMAERILPQSALWVGLALLLTWHHIWAAASGMETMLFSMMTFVLIFLAWRELDQNRIHATRPLLIRGAIFGVATALAALARPEGVLLGGIAAFLMLIVRPQGNFVRVIIYGIGAVIGFSIAISPYVLLNLQLTAGFLPNTASAKFEQHAILLQLPYLTRFFSLSKSIFAGGQFLLIPGMIAFVWMLIKGENRLKALYFLSPLFWPIALIAIYAARLPAWYQHGRYVMPALPSLVFIGAVGFVWLMKQSSMKSNTGAILWRITSRVWAISTALVYIYFVFIGMNAYVSDVQIINSEMVVSAEYIRDNIPEDEFLAIHDIGAVGYFAARPMLDIAGLVSPDLISIVANPDALWALMQERGVVYLMAFPDQIPGRNPDDSRLCPIFTTNSEITRRVRGAEGTSMTIYRIAWDASCEN
jgi:hypothetical protein